MYQGREPCVLLPPLSQGQWWAIYSIGSPDPGKFASDAQNQDAQVPQGLG